MVVSEEQEEKLKTELSDLVWSDRHGYCCKLRKSHEYRHLAEYVAKKTAFLDETERLTGTKFATMAVRAFYVLNDINAQLKCCVCGKPYTISKEFSVFSGVDVEHLHCCHVCAMNDQQTKTKIGDSIEKRFGPGIRVSFQAESIKNKSMDTCQVKYGSKFFTQSDEYHRLGEENGWWPETEDQRKARGLVLKQTLSEKSGEEKSAQVEKIRKTMLKLYGVDNYAKTPQSKARYADEKWSRRKKAREINTKILNGTMNSTAQEDAVYAALCQVFGENNVERQHKDAKYPYFCDFYVSLEDLYIECNFHWTHGGRQFDGNDSFCVEQLRKWHEKGGEAYNAAIRTWTERDPAKVDAAKSAGLNYIVFWSLREFNEWVSDQRSAYKS